MLDTVIPNMYYLVKMKNTDRMQVGTFRFPKGFWKPIDRWRKLQLPIPSRSEAIRKLTAEGLRQKP